MVFQRDDDPTASASASARARYESLDLGGQLMFYNCSRRSGYHEY